MLDIHNILVFILTHISLDNGLRNPNVSVIVFWLEVFAKFTGLSIERNGSLKSTSLPRAGDIAKGAIAISAVWKTRTEFNLQLFWTLKLRFHQRK